jgi:membrane-bound lytic murein transglycosylase A
MRRVIAAAAIALALAGCAVQPSGQPQPMLAGGETLSTLPVSALPGWSADDAAAALTAFVRGCKAIALMPPDQQLGGAGVIATLAGQAGLWQAPCAAAITITPGDGAAAQSFFATYFAAYQIGGSATITGYFEPEYPGSKNLTSADRVPLYAKPADPELAALPRAAIDHNALYRKAPVTAYLSNPVDAFMLQIQGAGRILLPDGRTLRVGFDGQNGQPYTPIGRILVADGDLSAGDVSFQSISAWLKSHPAEAPFIMEQNARYVYLRPLGDLPDDEGAPGTLGIPLTAGRSLAVDSAVIPLGMPVFIDTTDPLTGAPLQSLTIAQDTGGGIHGASAADLFFGAGPQAEAIAGQMHQPGHLYLLLPRSAGTT